MTGMTILIFLASGPVIVAGRAAGSARLIWVARAMMAAAIAALTAEVL